MIEILLQGKYDIDSFCYKDFFEVILSTENQIKRLNFGNRIVYTKFNEEELTDKINFSYYDLLGEKLRTTTLLQDVKSNLLQKIESDTGGFYSSDELKHYIVISENHIMEIVSFDDVKIE